MKHQIRKKKLGRTKDHREAMIANLAQSLIYYESIQTTTPRAKVLAGYFDSLVNTAKKNTEESRRIVSSKLNQDKIAVEKMFKVLIDQFQTRNSGYTRRFNIRVRTGDSAHLSR